MACTCRTAQIQIMGKCYYHFLCDWHIVKLLRKRKKILCNLKNDFQHLQKVFLCFKFCEVIWSLVRPSSILKIMIQGSNVINAPVHMLSITCHSFVNYVIYFTEVQQNNLWSLCLDFIHNVCLVVSWLSEWTCLHSFIQSICQQLLICICHNYCLS